MSILQPPPQIQDSKSMTIWASQIGRWFFEVYRLWKNLLDTNSTQTVTNKIILSAYRTTAISTALTDTDEILKVTATATITVPTAVGISGRFYRIDNAHTGTTTVTPTGAQTIEGETGQTIVGHACMVLYSDGANWRFS
jgi:hypothetical protein